MKEKVNELPKSVRDELARQQASGTHPDADLLTAYSEGTATPSERESIEQHLAVCGDCREVLFLSLPEKPAETPAVVATKSRSRWFPVWAPWAAAAAVLIVGTFTFTRQQSPSREAKLSKIEAPPAPTTKVPAPSETEESKEKFHANLDSVSPTQKEPPANAVPEVAAPKAKEPPTSDKITAERERRDELKKSEVKRNEDAYSYSMPSKDGALAGSTINGGAQPAIAPPPEPPTYAARAAKNSALKPGPAAPTQNQLQNQAQNQAAPTVPVGSASQTVEVTAETGSVPVQDSKIAGGLTAEISSRKAKAITNWRISSSGSVQRELAPGNWETSLDKPHTAFTVVAAVGQDIWAGGTHGALYHSVDGGKTWRPIFLPGIGDQTVTAIEFRDVWHGQVSTPEHHSWTTTDRGDHWQQP